MKLHCPKCSSTNIVKDGANGKGRQQYKCGDCGAKPTNPLGVEAALSAGISKGISKAIAREVTKAKGVRRYVITAAQNATPVWKPFWSALNAYMDHNKADLIVIPIRYHNPTSMWSQAAQSQDWWAEELIPYITEERIPLGDHMLIMGDVKTQPTARRPLGGFETISRERSAVFGHPKLELTSIATPQQRLPKILTTTGAVTVPNYIAGKAGKMGEFHHTAGAAIVEVTPAGGFHLRQVNATKDGSFIDLDSEYLPDGKVGHAGPIEALVMGDWHQRFNDEKVRGATFGKDGIVPVLKPKVIVWHDVFDGFARNPHDWRDPVRTYVKHNQGFGNVKGELLETYDAVDSLTPKGTLNVFPFSNHHDFLNRWVKRVDPRLDPENAIFWAESYAAMLKAARMTDNGVKEIDLFEYWARQYLTTYKRSKFLGPDDSFPVLDVELGMHGHLGANGADGELRSFAKFGSRSITGHSHSPGIVDGAYRVGTSSRLRVDYNRGPSSWLQTHALVYRNGKRTLVNIIDGNWRAK